MDCREFRDNHALYIDQQCSAVEEDEMRQHAQQCAACARHDTMVRRSLIVFRSLPTIELSPDFQARLNERLRGVTRAAPIARPAFQPFAAIAAGVVFLAYLAAEIVMRGTGATTLQLAPVVATAPDVGNSPVASPALVATVPSGMSVWPAIMVASQSVHFVAAELATER